MPIKVDDKLSCTGCGACVNACPKKCINMVPDESGFIYPKVIYDNCINCEVCSTICPMVNMPHIEENETPQVYAVWSKDKDVRYTSTSGGVFSELAFSILDLEGMVVGAAYNKSNLVEHILIEKREEVNLIRQSKYIQSDTLFVYQEIKQALNFGRIVLFCGAPCQVAALKSFLRMPYDGLYTADFICRGMNSPKAYLYWLRELEEIHHSKVTKVWFKYKLNGWKKSPRCTRIDFENGTNCVANAEHNYFMKGYLEGNLYLRPSCSACLFKGVERHSDITLADFWKIPEKLDDDNGTSMVMINSAAGLKLFEMTKHKLEIHVRSFEEISVGNVCFNNSVIRNEKSDEFLQRVGTKPFSKLVMEYTKLSTHARVVKACKKVVKKILGRY